MRAKYKAESKIWHPDLRAKERNKISALESRINKRKQDDGLKAVKSEVMSVIYNLDELIDEQNKKRIVAFYA